LDHYCVTFPLKTEKYQEDILNKRFEIGRRLYNAVLSKAHKRYLSMIRTRKYRKLIEQIRSTSDSTERKQLYKLLNDMYRQYRLSEYAFQKDVQKMQHYFSKNIDSFTAQKIVTRVWSSLESLLFKNGESVHFKRYGQLNSLEGKSNKTGIRFRDNFLIWNGVKIPVRTDYSNPYECQAMQGEICYCRIKRKFVRNKYKYYLQIVFKGTPPAKIDKNGEFKRRIGNGPVGLDIGTQTIAIVSNADVRLIELADRVDNIEKEKRRILRYLDRSRRITNPDNFDEDGTVKKGRLEWKKSNRYIKAQKKLKELYRKQADVREYQHQLLSNYILSLGNRIKVEDMDFSALQRRSKKTEKNYNGKFRRKKRFGKSLANKAPAKLLTILDNKLRYFGEMLIRVNTKEVRASQYDHFDSSYNKKELSQRWNDFNGVKVQRDLYSAFLIQHVKDDLSTIDQDGCVIDFEKFKAMHDKEIERLSNSILSKPLRNVV